jgi:UDP-3-O-[3-hydroxymyristoyl] glucosamine N-acyltransferase
VNAVATITLGDIAAHLGGELTGDPLLTIDRVGPLESATPHTISFISNPRYQAQLASSSAGCVIVGPALRDAALARGAALVLPDPYLAFARLTQWWVAQHRPPVTPGVHPTAVVHPSARVATSASLGPFVVVEAHAVIGEGAQIGAHGFVGRGSTVGADTRFAPRVTFNHGCHIGARGMLHPGVVVGGDGFGFAPNQGRWEKIEQLGGVRIGDDVEIGSNTCVDRGALDDTVLEEGVKLDNLIQIAHNVKVGAFTAMAGCAGVAGSTVIGKHCTIGGAAMIVGHLKIADHVNISGCTAVTRSISKPGVYTGLFPMDDNATWEKNAATLRNLHALRDRVRALEKKN